MNKSRFLSSICYGENRKSQILFIVDGILINGATILTNGVFLSGFIVYLNGSDFLVGLLNNSANWASIVSIMSFLIFEKMKKRKKFLITLNMTARILICSIVFLPIVFHNSRLILNALAFMVVTGNIIWGFYSIGITVMMVSLLDNETRNQFIYVRMFWLRISFTISSVIMGFVLDYFNKGYNGFLVVFITSLVLSLADAAVLSRVDEPEYNIENSKRVNPNLFFEPIKDKNYRRFIVFIFLFYLFLTASTSYTSLYLIRYLKFDYSFITIINVVQYILMVVCTNFWRRIEREKGIKYVLLFTSCLAVAEVFIYSFLTDKTYFLLFIAPVISGIGYGGFNIAIMNYRYELIPENNKTIYEGWFNAAFGLSNLISPIAGSIIMNTLPVVNNSIYMHSSFQFLYLISAICTIAAIFLTLGRHRENSR